MAPPKVPQELLELLAKLSKTKLSYVASVVTTLLGDMTEERNAGSDLVSEIFLEGWCSLVGSPRNFYPTADKGTV